MKEDPTIENRYTLPRVLTLVAALMLVGAIFLPIWQIQLSAPQYPEGLVLKINADGLSGNVDVVNGLNHYIGMQTLHSEDFIEFTLLPYIIGLLVLLGLLTVVINKKGLYYTYIGLFMAVAVISMIDFYRWEYNYGHNLDPNAAIQVPGMYYQPPLIGYKQLLNFGAYSIPDVGGWMFIGAGVLLFVAYLMILRPKWFGFKYRKLSLATLLLLFMQSCSSGPQPIKYGSDACDFCKMTIMDKKFAGEWVNDKGKVYRFDDVHCLVSFMNTDRGKGIAYVNDYTGHKDFEKASELHFIKSEHLKTPMGGQLAAFADKAAAEGFLKHNDGAYLSWQQVQEDQKK